MLPFTLFENVEQAKSYLKKNNIPETDWVYKLIRELFKGKEGYIGWITRIAYSDLVPGGNKREITTTLQNLATKLSTEKHILDTLPKPIIQYETHEEFIDDFEKQVLQYKAKKTWDEFPSTQKGLMRMSNKGDVSLLAKLHDDSASKVFLRKIAAYKTRDSLVDAIKRFINKSGSSDFDSLLRNLHKEGLPIVHADEVNNLVIARIEDYEQCVAVGSRTSWCIARNASTFRSYVPDGLTRQYVIYQTDLPPSDDNNIIGVTYNLQGFRTAHNRRDSYIDRDQLKNMLKSHEYDVKGLHLKIEDLNRDDINNAAVRDLKRMGQTNEQIIKIKTVYRSGDLTHFTKEELEEYDLLNKTAIDGGILNKFTREEIISKGLLNRIENSTLGITMLLELGFNPHEIKNIPDLKTKLFDDDWKYYNNYLKKTKAELVKRGAHELQFGSRWSSSDRDDRYDLEKTLGIMRWYKIGPSDFPLERLAGALDDVSSYQFKKVKDYLDEFGYKYTDEQFLKFILEVSKRDNVLDNNAALIELGYDRWDDIFENLFQRMKPVPSYEIDKIKKLLADGGKTEELERFLKLDEKNTFIEQTEATAGFANRNTRGALTTEDWWKKWGNYGTMLDYDKRRSYSSDEASTLLSYVLLTALNNKWEYLYNLKYDWEASRSRSWSTGTRLEQLAKIICGTLFYNQDPRYKKETALTQEQREKLYEWVIKHVWPSITDKSYFKHDLQVLYFIFDRPKFYQYLDEVKKLKDNYDYITTKDTKAKATRRFIELKPIIDYLKKPIGFFADKIENITELRKVLTYFMDGIKMLQAERESMYWNLAEQDLYRDEEKTKSINKILEELFDIKMKYGGHYDKFNIIDNQKIARSEKRVAKAGVKESVIISYDRFLNEGIRNMMTPKSEEEITNELNKLSPTEKLIKACEIGMISVVRQSLGEGADPTYNSNLAIAMASNCGHFDIVELLLNDKRVNPTDYNNRAIHWTNSSLQNKDIIKLLLNDVRVRRSLSDEEIEKYTNIIKRGNQR